ncbi:MAG: GNAT family N-acetyltransferase [Kiloniellales bacterium]
MSAEDYSFRAASADDLPLLRRWLKTPEVVRWWGPPEREEALLAEDLGVPEMAQWIVSHRGRPFAYAQACEVQVWPQPHLAHLPRGAKAIDAFIGEAEMIGRGHGAIFLRLLAQRLIAEGAPAVAIDPAADNLHARRAYARAGFAGEAVVETAEGPAVVMLFEG